MKYNLQINYKGAMPKLYEARKKMKMSRKELSEKTGISQRSIQRYEEGERSPNFETLGKIASSLGVDFISLIDSLNPILSDFSQNPEHWHEATQEEILDMAKDKNRGFALQRFASDDKAPAKDRLNAAFDQLNDPGQAKAVEQVEILTKVPEYQRTPDQEEE
ncbi:MAG: helix-turn-helix transcriptional regulator [Eubacterium sp.]